MRVALVGPEFPRDAPHLALLAGEVDLVLYGHDRRLRGQTAPATPPPSFCAARRLRPVVLTPRGPLVWFYPGLRRALAADRPDVVHVVAEPWRPVAVQAAAWARGRPAAGLTLHTADRNWWAVPAAERAARRPLARRMLARVDGFASESEAGVREAVEFGLAPGASTAVINPHPRDPDVFRPAAGPDERARIRRALGLPVKGIGVGFIGRLLPEKGPELFLDALDRLRDRNGFWATVAGMGPLEPEVRRRAEPPRVTFLGRLDFPAQVADFYRALDVVVVPSVSFGRWEEQGGRAVVEAMLSGCVVVATDVGALPERVSGAGVVVGPDAGALAEGIVQAFERDGRPGRERAVGRWSAGATARQLLDLWGGALARRRA